MDSFAFFNFVIKKNDKLFQFSVQPGTPWEEAQSALDDFKSELENLKSTKANEAPSQPVQGDAS
jgi:hypothetical protein